MDGSLAERRARGALDAILTDEAAFRDWYDAALPQVYRYLFHRCGRDRELAEELTQQTFVDALRSRTGLSAERREILRSVHRAATAASRRVVAAAWSVSASNQIGSPMTSSTSPRSAAWGWSPNR